MTTVDEIFLNVVPKREPKRNQWGQYVIPERTTGTEVGYQRATTLARMLDDTYSLDRWQKRMTAKGLSLRPDLFAQVAAATLDEKALLDEVCEAAQEAAGSSVGRNVGSALHRFAQRSDAGETVAPPAPYDKDIAAYRQALADAEITPVANMSERIIVVPSIGVAGTFDRILESPRWSKPRIGDLKTAQKIYDWLTIAVQLAIYARGDSIWDLDAEAHQPMPDVDQDLAIVMHVQAGSGICTLYEVDIAAGWQAALLAVEVRARRKTSKTLASELNPAAPVAVGAPDDGGLRAEHARQRLIVLADRKATVGWPTGVQTFKEQKLSRHVFTHDELLLIEAALTEAEKVDETPFGPDEPRVAPERQAALVERIKGLPKEQLDEATGFASKHLIPRLSAGLMSIRHADLLEPFVAGLELRATGQASKTLELLGGYGDDEQLGLAIVRLAGCPDLASVDDESAVKILAVVDALDGDLIVVNYTDAGDVVFVCAPHVEELIVKIGGGVRARAVVYCKEAADRFGVPRHRSVGAAAADPLLAALIVREAAVPA